MVYLTRYPYKLPQLLIRYKLVVHPHPRLYLYRAIGQLPKLPHRKNPVSYRFSIKPMPRMAIVRGAVLDFSSAQRITPLSKFDA